LILAHWTCTLRKDNASRQSAYRGIGVAAKRATRAHGRLLAKQDSFDNSAVALQSHRGGCLRIARTEIDRMNSMKELTPTTWSRFRRLHLTAKVAVAAIVIFTNWALLAQAPPAVEVAGREETDTAGYKYMVPKEQWRKRPSDANSVRNNGIRPILQTPGALGDRRAQFRDYFLAYLFPMMTTDEGLKTAAKDRQDLFRDLQNSKNPEAHKEIVDMALQTMSRIVRDKEYRPAARYNAMLLISNLNDQEPAPFASPPTLPEPMRAALPIILEQFQTGDTDEIKIGALIGLSRHLEWENYKPAGSTPIPANARAVIIKELVALTDMKDPPSIRDAEVHAWMRRRAVEALVMACTVKADADVAAAIERQIKDESNPTSVRLAAASALGRITLQGTKIEAPATAKELGYLTMSACDAALTRAEAQRKADYEHVARLAGTYTGEGEYSGGPGGMPGMPGGPGGGRPPGMPGGPGISGGGMGEGIKRGPGPGAPGMGEGPGGFGADTLINTAESDPKHYQMEYLRRRLRQDLYAIQQGLAGSDDFVKKTTGSPPPPPAGGGAAAGGTGATGSTSGDKKGVHSIAKGQAEQDQVKEVYYKVRKLAEVVEQGADLDFYTFVKDMRKELKNLELLVGTRAPAAGAPGGAPGDDAPGGAPVGGKGPAKKGPAKGMPPTGKGKSAARPQPQVFGQPRIK
jgi:hypothetical protein